jgi:hypothetical protein
MKKTSSIFFFLLFLCACTGRKDSGGTSDSDIDAARNFIRAALDGNFQEARRYMLQDSVNNSFMDVRERIFQRIDPETRNSYRAASIIIHNTNELNDSTAIIIFSNSFKNDHDTLRIVKKNQRWLVDPKYLIDRSDDSIYTKRISKDTIHVQ